MRREIYGLYNEQSLVQINKAQIRQWLSHLEILTDDKLVKELRWRKQKKKKDGVDQIKAVKENFTEKTEVKWKEIAKDRQTQI